MRLARGKPWPDIHEIRGLARASRGDYAGAIDDYSHALVLRPGQPRLLSSRGLAYLVSDAPRLALRDFDEALRLRPLQRRGPQRPGPGAGAPGRPSRAIAEAEESLRHDAPTARRAYNAARIYAQAAIAAAAEVTEKGRLAVTLVERYQDRAVALVKLALERTPAERRAAFWQDQVAADPALRSLQRRLRRSAAARHAIGPETTRNSPSGSEAESDECDCTTARPRRRCEKHADDPPAREADAFSQNALPRIRRAGSGAAAGRAWNGSKIARCCRRTASDVLAGIAIPIALGTPTTGTLAAGDTIFYQVNPTAEGKLVAEVHAEGGTMRLSLLNGQDQVLDAERRPVARQPRRPDRRGRPGGARVPRGGKPRRCEHLHLDDLFDAIQHTVSADFALPS